MSNPDKDSNLIETRMRVLSWNIWWRFGPWERRRPAIAATLASLDADIIALQEVWSDKDTNLAAELGKELGYHHVFARSMDIKGFGFGNAILSRWPIKENDQTMLFGQEETGEGRLALFAQIEGPHGLVPLFSTHLNWKYEHAIFASVRWPTLPDLLTVRNRRISLQLCAAILMLSLIPRKYGC